MTMTRVVIADDHHIFRQGLLALLCSIPDLAVVGEAANGNEALRLIVEHRPDLAILDVAMPGCGVLEVVEEIRRKQCPTRVILLTMHGNAELVQDAVKAGVSGFVLKENAFDDLRRAIEDVLRGETAFSPHLTEEASRAPESKDSGRGSLTPREREILKWIVAGLTNKQIADRLCISVKTVETHRTRLMYKLDLHTTADLVRYALQHRLAEW